MRGVTLQYPAACRQQATRWINTPTAEILLRRNRGQAPPFGDGRNRFSLLTGLELSPSSKGCRRRAPSCPSRATFRFQALRLSWRPELPPMRHQVLQESSSQHDTHAWLLLLLLAPSLCLFTLDTMNRLVQLS